jgi:hypothetical protein
MAKSSPRPAAPRPVTEELFTAAAPAAKTVDQRMPAFLLAVFCLLLLILFRARADDPLGVRTDSWSEANIVVSARNVATNGWTKYGGVAQHQVDRRPFKSDPFYYYAHYPLGTYYIVWVEDALGLHTFSAWRWLPTLCSIGALVLWYLLLCRFVGRWTALASTIVMGTSYGFLAYADNIHHGYNNLLLLGMMLLYVTGITHRGRPRLVRLGGSWLLLFVNAFMSWEWYLWSQAFYWGHAILFGAPFKKRWLLIFAAAPLLAAGIQYGVRVSAFGRQSEGAIVQDFLRRTIRLQETADTPPDVTLANYPQHVAQRFQQFYGIDLASIWLLALLWGALLGGFGPDLRTSHPAFRWIVLLFVCSATWWCVMLQHTAVHQHVMRHALFFYALVIGLVLVGGLAIVVRPRYSPWSRAVSLAVVVLILWSHADGCYRDLRLHLDPSYRDPNSWAAGWQESRDFAATARSLPQDAIILTNNNRLPLLRYWTNRPVYPATLEKYPFRRGTSLPQSRFRLELVTSHLRDLYGDHMPRVVYLYFFYGAPDSAYERDAILWGLMDGVWTPPTADRFENFARVMRQAGGTTVDPIVARGRNWLCFDAGAFLRSLPEDLLRQPPPARADFGPPR